MVLFGGFHGFDDSGGESVVFQFIDPLDCDSARSGDLVDFYAGVGVVVLNGGFGKKVKVVKDVVL